MADKSGVDFGNINQQIVDPKQYRAFFKSNNQIDYSKIADNVGVLLDTEQKRRDGIKKDINDNTDSLVEQLGNIETNSDSVFSDGVIDMASQARDNLMTYNKALESGKTTASQYKKYLQRVKTQMSTWNGVTKTFGAYVDKSKKRINTTSEATGNMLASPYEVTIGESVHGFGKSTQNSMYLDGVSGQAFSYKRDKDGNVPNFKKNPELFTSIDNFKANMSYEQDRDQFDIQNSVKQEKDLLGTITNSYQVKFGKQGDRQGRYVMTTEDYTIMANDPRFKADIDGLKDTIYQKVTAQGDNGLGQTAATMNSDFKVVLSAAEFEEKHAGVDKKYMIIINPEDPNGLSTTFGDKKFVESQVKGNIDENVAMQLGGSRKITSQSYEPNEDIGSGDRERLREKEIGYARRINNIMSADALTATSDMEDTIKELNLDTFNEARGIVINQIDRQANGISIERTKNDKEDDTFISYYFKKDGQADLTKPRPAKEIAKEIFRDLIPNSITKNTSFDAWYDQAIEEDPNMFTPHLIDNPDFITQDANKKPVAETPFGGTNAKQIKNPKFKGNELTSTVEKFEVLENYNASNDIIGLDEMSAAQKLQLTAKNEDSEEAGVIVGDMFKNAFRNISINNNQATAEITVDEDAFGQDGTINVKIFDPVLNETINREIRYDGDVANLISKVEEYANSVISNYNQANKDKNFGGVGAAGSVDTSIYNTTGDGQ